MAEEYSKDMQPLIQGVIIVLFILGEGSALIRLYTKFFCLRNWGWDDWAMALVAIVNIGQHTILELFLQVGAGRPQAEVLENDPNALMKMQKRLFAEEIWYLFLHFWIKMSFLLFFLRLSPKKGFRLAVYCTIAANVIVTVGTWVLYCLQCIPIEAYWNPAKYPDVQCLPFALSLWLPASALIAVDWAIFFIPITTVWSLQMTTKRRLQVLAVVCTGGISVVVSCLRLIVIHEFTITTDFIYEVGNICIVSAAEMEVAIVAANMPGINALWKAKFGGSTLGTGSGPSRQGGSGKVGTGDYALKTFGSKPTRSRTFNETFMYTRHQEEGVNVVIDADSSSTRQLTRRTDSDDETRSDAHAKGNDIMVSRRVVISEEHVDRPKVNMGNEVFGKR